MEKQAIPITLIALGTATILVGLSLAKINEREDPYHGYPWYIHNNQNT